MSMLNITKQVQGVIAHCFYLKCCRVDPGEVTFKVEKNSKGYDAIDVARHVGKRCIVFTLFLHQIVKL